MTKLPSRRESAVPARASEAKPQSPTIFAHFFDPRQSAIPSKLLLHAKLHLLLCDSLAIQDNFLISRLLEKSRDEPLGRSPLCEWIERGWLRVALRQDSSSILDLKDQLQKNPGYLPFEGLARGHSLYRSAHFNRYLRELDSSLSSAGAAIPWDPRKLGERLRTNMRKSAEDGSSRLPADAAMAIWSEIDQESEGAHSRSMYHTYAERLPVEQAKLVEDWVTQEYIRNLPHSLNFGISMSAGMAESLKIFNPIKEVKETEVRNRSMIVGRDLALLSPGFLSSLSVKDIERMRGLRQFERLTGARQSGDPNALNVALQEYLKAIGEEAPKIWDPKIQRLENHVRIKTGMQVVAGLGGIYLKSSSPFLAELLAASAIFLRLTKGSEGLVRERRDNALFELESRRSGGLLDLCHEDDVAAR
jgi:hypothetical protein